MAAGDVMNTAARLQGGAPVDGIAVGEATYRATAHVFEYQEAEPIAAKGKAEPVPVWIVLGEKVAPKRPEAWRRLVGREEEMAQLASIWDRALFERRAQLATVLGAPGIGKSRLAVELSHVVDPDVAMYWGRCLPYGEGITYWPVTEIVKDAAGIPSDDDAAGVLRKLGALLARLPTDDRDELRTMAAALSNLLGAGTTPEGTYSTDEIGQAELHWGIRRFLELYANQQPLVLVFEDLHWAEPTLLELILSLLESAVPLLVLGTARPELADAEPEFVHSSENRHLVMLEPLAETASLALVEELVGPSGVGGARFRLLLERAGGNPLFLEETIRMLADVDAETDIESVPVPESLQALIGSRLDALPRGDKRVAQQASVVGAVFWHGAVAHLARSSDRLDERFQALEHRDFIHPRAESSIAAEREFGFKHILIRDVAYERLPKGRRAELHVRFSEWVTGLPAPEHELVEIVAYHLEQACRLAREVQQSPVPPPIDQAAAALTRAGQKAERRGGIREADRYYLRALELLEDRCSETALDLRVRRAFTRNVIGEVTQAAEELASAADDAKARGHIGIRGNALAMLGQIDLRQGRIAEARDRLAEAHEIACRTGDRALEVRAVYRLAALSGDFEGELERAVEDARKGLQLADEIDDRALQIEGHLRLGLFLQNLGRLAEAEEELKHCLRLSEETGSLRDDAQATYVLAAVRYYRGDVEEAERLALQAQDWLERTGETYIGTQNLIALAKCALARNDPDAAERWLQEALPPALDGGGWLVVWVARHLVEALVRQGRVDDAATLAEFAAREAPEDPYTDAQVLLAEGAVAFARGNPVAAAASYETAVALLADQQLPPEVAEARVEFARALGDGAQARMELNRARETFAQMGAASFVAEIDGLLIDFESEGAGVPGPLGG
jgi:predicted ATPase